MISNLHIYSHSKITNPTLLAPTFISQEFHINLQISVTPDHSLLILTWAQKQILEGKGFNEIQNGI